MSRHLERNDLTGDVRMRLIDDDLDRQEQAIDHTKNTLRTLIDALRVELTHDMAGIKTDMKAGFAECESRDDSTRKLLTALLVSIVTLCVTVTVGVLVTVGSAG